MLTTPYSADKYYLIACHLSCMCSNLSDLRNAHYAIPGVYGSMLLGGSNIATYAQGIIIKIEKPICA